MKKYITIEVTEERSYSYTAELPEGETIESIQQKLNDRGLNWYRFEKYSEPSIEFNVEVAPVNLTPGRVEDWDYIAE